MIIYIIQYLNDIKSFISTGQSALVNEIKCTEPNTEPTECGKSCEPTCSNPNPKMCVTMCKPGCICKKGFIRDNSRKQCIREGNCPRRSVKKAAF